MIEIEKFNESFLRVFGDRDVLQEIKDFFTFKAPGYKYHPKYKARLWDGNISLFNMQTNKLPHGLLELLKVYCQRSQVEYKLVEKSDVSPFDPEPITLEAFEFFVSSLKIAKGGEAIDPYPYQVEAAFKAIKFRRMTLEMPTGSGKSLTIYLIIRWMMKEGLRTKLIVPSISLTKQMVSDFMEYSELDETFDVDEACAILFSGQEKNFNTSLLVSTWQSLAKFVKDSKGIAVLNSYDCIIVDEAHSAKGVELQKILEACVNVPWKIGTTGTIDKEKVNELTIIGALGPKEVIKTTRELIDEGKLAGLIIKPIVIKYPEAECKEAKGLDYQGELSFIMDNEFRNRCITNFAILSAKEGTVMVLFQYIDKHLKVLAEQIKAKAAKHGIPVYEFHGVVSPDERERIRKLANEQNCILLCSYQVAQQGINIPNIATVIFAAPSKSAIRVLQSIGRGLRLFEGKVQMVLLDIVDDLRYKKSVNVLFTHFMERLKTYRAEKFDVSIQEITPV